MNDSALAYWKELRASVTDKQIKSACRYHFMEHLEGQSCSVQHSVKQTINNIADHFQCDRSRVERLMDEVRREIMR